MTYYSLGAFTMKLIIVCIVDMSFLSPAVQQSGKGGTFVLPTTNITAAGGEVGSVAPGAPYFGSDSQNSDFCK